MLQVSTLALATSIHTLFSWSTPSDPNLQELFELEKVEICLEWKKFKMNGSFLTYWDHPGKKDQICHKCYYIVLDLEWKATPKMKPTSHIQPSVSSSCYNRLSLLTSQWSESLWNTTIFPQCIKWETCSDITDTGIRIEILGVRDSFMQGLQRGTWSLKNLWPSLVMQAKRKSWRDNNWKSQSYFQNFSISLTNLQPSATHPNITVTAKTLHSMHL